MLLNIFYASFNVNKFIFCRPKFWKYNKIFIVRGCFKYFYLKLLKTSSYVYIFFSRSKINNNFYDYPANLHLAVGNSDPSISNWNWIIKKFFKVTLAVLRVGTFQRTTIYLFIRCDGKKLKIFFLNKNNGWNR